MVNPPFCLRNGDCMLSKKEIKIESKSVVDGKEIMGFRAIFKPDESESVRFLPYQIDAEACKEHRNIVREDQAAFEDYAYKIQEDMMEGK